MIFQLPVALPLSVCPLQYFRVITVRMGNSSGNSKCDANRTHIRHPHTRNSRSFSGQNANRWGQCQGFVSLWLLPNCPLSLLPGVMLMSLHRAEQPHFGISEWQIKLIHFHLWSRVWDVESSAQGKSFILYKQQLLLKLSTVYILYCQNRLFEWYKTFL